MPPPGPIAVILNAGAGTAIGRPNIAAELVDLFRAAGRHAEISVLHPGHDPNAVIKQASASAAIVVAAGGDGTVQQRRVGRAGIPGGSRHPAARHAQSFRQGSSHPVRSARRRSPSSRPAASDTSTSAW